MVKMILRVPKEFGISPELQKSLLSVLGDFEVISYDLKASLEFSVHYQERINSILNAFKFLLTHIPGKNQPALLQLISFLEFKYALPENLGQDACQQALGECLGILIDALEQEYNIPEWQAVHYLNLAEQYYLLQKGRPNQATLSNMSENPLEPYFILQVDRRMQPLHLHTQNELYKIKESNLPSQLTKDFARLPPPLKLYLLETRHIHQDQMVADMQRLIALCNTIAKEDASLLPSHLHPSLEEPEWFKKLAPETLKPLFRELYDIHHRDIPKIFSDLTTYKEKIRSFCRQPEENALNTEQNSKERLASLRKLPFWYYQLDSWEQIFVRGVLQDMDFEHCDEWYFPSRLRSGIPALANAGTHQLYKVVDNKIHALSGERKRSAHPASRDTKSSPWAIQSLHCMRNLEQLQQHSEEELYVGTLISPVPYSERVIPDRFLYRTLTETIQTLSRKTGRTIHATNHPLNVAREWYYTNLETKSCSTFLANVKKRAKGLPSEHRVNELIGQYENLLRTVPQWHDLRELFLAAQEHVSAHDLKLNVHGACVSCKDRFALLLMMTNSMWIFYDRYERWPEYDKSEDMNLLRPIFVHQVQTRHQIREAEYGAPGSFGIKTLHKYLPKDYVELLEKSGLLATSLDRMATNNELKKIDIINFRSGYARALMLAQSIPENVLNKICDQACHYLPASLREDFPPLQEPYEPSQALEWVAELLSAPKTAVYVRWLIQASGVEESDIRDVLSLIHLLSQQNDWVTTNVTAALSFGMYGVDKNLPPIGISKIRNVMTKFEEVEANPLGVLTNVLFLARAQLSENAGWLSSITRDPNTGLFYKRLDAFLNDKHLKENWATLCNDIKKMVHVKSLTASLNL